MIIDSAYTNFACYEDSVEFLGIVDATLPDIAFMLSTVNGAGIAGELESVMQGMLQKMTLGLTWRTLTENEIRLAEPRRHLIDLRAAREDDDNGDITIHQVKHVMAVVPTSTGVGKVAPASTGDGNGQYSVHYWATYIDGVQVMELDPGNFKCMINGVDYAAPTRAAIGK